MHRFALLGAGFMGAVHGANLAVHPGVTLASVYDVAPERAARLAQTHSTRAATTLEEVFDPDRIDAVVIASSTDTHASLLRRAAAANIAAFCEKPIDHDLSHAVETVAAVRASGITAMVDFNRRFDRDYVELKRIVDAGGVGAPELLTLTSRGPTLPAPEYLRVSGGQMRDQTIHFFDLARWSAGCDPVEIHVTGAVLADSRLAEIPDVDTSIASLRLRSGALVQIDSVRRTGYGYDERIEVMGATGLVEAGRHRSGCVAVHQGAHTTRDGAQPDWFERVRGTYALALAAFVDGLDQHAAPPVTLDDGLAAQAIAEAATRSLASGLSEPIDYLAGWTATAPTSP